MGLVYDSAERPAPMLEELMQLWRYRELVVQLVSRNLKARYKRSVLGIAWTMLNPLMMMVVLTFVFSQLFKLTVVNYSVYLLAGIMLWNFFSQTTVWATSEILWGAGLLKRIYVPRTIFAVSSICTGIVNLLLALAPLMLVMLGLGVQPSLAMLTLPFSIFLVGLFALGVGLIVSLLAVYFADAVEIYQIVLSVWMYLTPIIYPIDIIPEPYRWVIQLNPMYHLVQLFRTPIYQGTLTSLETTLTGIVVALGMLFIGWWFFTKYADQVAYRS